MEGSGIERNLHLYAEWYSFWSTAESPSLYEGFIRACSGHRSGSEHLRHLPGWDVKGRRSPHGSG